MTIRCGQIRAKALRTRGWAADQLGANEQRNQKNPLCIPSKGVEASSLAEFLRIRVPDQDRVDTSVTFLEVVKITVHRIAASDEIIEVAVLDHHLGLDETRLHS